VDAEQAQILVRLLTEDPPRPRSIEKGIPEGVEVLIQRAMARAPKDRPASADELDGLLAPFDEQGLANIAISERGPKSLSAQEASGEIAKDMTRRARYARPATIGVSFIAIVANGAAAMTAAAVGLRVLGGSEKPLGLRNLTIAGAIAGGVILLLWIYVLSVLIRRWRSLPSIDRLRGGLWASIHWLFGLLGLLAMLWIGVSHMVPSIPAAWIGPIDLGIVLLPALLALTAMIVGGRRAARAS